MNTTNQFVQLLQSFDLESFLTQNKQMDASRFLLAHKGNTNDLNWLLAEQIKLYPKALHKLPHFVKNHCWFTSKSYEQASGEASALYKSKLISGAKLLDLSGGLGVDDWAFSRNFDKVVSLDPDEKLNEIVRENFRRLHCNNIERINITAESYLNSNLDHFDLIYLDADRRPAQGKSYFLDHDDPNFLAIQDACFKRSNQILLKLSPMADIHYLQENLQHIEKIMVVGDKKEVKEVLVLLNKKGSTTIIYESVLLRENEPHQIFSSKKELTLSISSELKSAKYFFEPHVTIIKAQHSRNYAQACELEQLAINSAFYIGNHIPPEFMGRSFEIVKAFEFSKSLFQQYLKNEKLVKANITKRNFVLSVEEIRKAYKIKEGGKDYLFFSTLSNGTRMVYHCIKAV